MSSKNQTKKYSGHLLEQKRENIRSPCLNRALACHIQSTFKNKET
ncbi:hypothetical protein HMPREF6485_1658 [Segatella buccae ATCC 33574]|jgi:hypothetical protein|uniref:Uncharacterized protein n=1 Tax=Segatella buccae ATCC 33574 TaxID=873513 RepID=E6K879_9BACT|nr:hypothetical protein HMPREF6485_1658 [Segatella buccae ATCC 33574]